MKKVDHDLSLLMNLALTADDNKEKNNSSVICDNDLEIIKSNIPSNMTEDERMLFTCLQEVELHHMLKNKNRKGLLKKKANSLSSKNLKTLLHRIANLPDYKLDEFFKIFIEGFTIPKKDKLNMFTKIPNSDI